MIDIKEQLEKEIERVLIEKGWNIVEFDDLQISLKKTPSKARFRNDEGFAVIAEALLTKFNITEKN